MDNRFEINKKMLNKEVFVTTDGGWKGIVIEVKKGDRFVVMNSRKQEEVDIFDIREDDSNRNIEEAVSR